MDVVVSGGGIVDIVVVVIAPVAIVDAVVVVVVVVGSIIFEEVDISVIVVTSPSLDGLSVDTSGLVFMASSAFSWIFRISSGKCT